MENIILIIHLVIALFLIAVVLLQRSEGGALGMGGGGGGDLLTGRGAANALTKATWGLGAAFIATSMILTILAVRGTQDTSVIIAPAADGGAEILVPDFVDSPLAPPADGSPAAPPPSDQ